MEQQPLLCPYCSGTVPPDHSICPDCQEDLAPLLRLILAPAIPYNEALALAREGQLERARDKLGVALDLAPDLAPAHRLLAKVCAVQGDWPAARRSAARALSLCPGDEQVRRLAADIEGAAQQALKGLAVEPLGPDDEETTQGGRRVGPVASVVGAVSALFGRER